MLLTSDPQPLAFFPLIWHFLPGHLHIGAYQPHLSAPWILACSLLRLRIQPARRPQVKKAPKRLDVSKLIHDSMRQAFINDISNQLGAMNLSSEDPEENWTVFQKVVHSSAATTIGHPSRKHQDWLDENDEEIKLLLEEKHCLHKAHQDDTRSVSKKAA